MREKDYPNQYAETKCAHDSQLTLKKKIRSWGRVEGTEAVKAKLQDGPLAVAIAAGSYLFQFYKSGVIRKGTGCESGIDHVVVLTGYDETEGYWKLQNSWSTAWGEDGFVKVEINEEGSGACEMNDHIYWVE